MPKLPVVSGEKVIKLLRKLGYEIIRQKGSHVRLRKITEAGDILLFQNILKWQKEH